MLPKILLCSNWDMQEDAAQKIIAKFYSADIAAYPQKKAADIVDIVLNSEFGKEFENAVCQIQIEKLYKSDIHGQDHVERVCLLAACLAIMEGVDKHTFLLCLEAAKYHDIGRCDDSEDQLHGCRGAAKIKGCCPAFDKQDRNIIAAVVEAHSLLDEEAEKISIKYGLQNPCCYEKYLQIVHIVKDADALDRFRLTDHSLKTKFLRMESSLHLIQAACEINQIQASWRIAVVSYTKETLRIIKRLNRRMPNIDIQYILEKDYTLWNEKPAEKIEIISMEHGIRLYKTNWIHKIIIPCIKKGSVLNSMYLPLRRQEVLEQDLLYAPYGLVYEGETEIDSSEAGTMLCKFSERTELDRIEIHINDNCNLICANCSMFAGLVDSNVCADYEITRKALFSLKRIYTHICEIDIIGGEPLLNPQIEDYCILLRQLYPLAYIFIVTNGIQLPYMKREFIEIIRKNRIYLSVTYYPGYKDLIQKIRKICKEHEIRLELLPKRVQFIKLYDFSGKASSEEMFERCKRKFAIIAMRENKLAVCYAPFALPYAEEKVHIGFQEEKVIDLFEESLTNTEIMKRFSKPMDCCRFCHNDTVLWEQSTENDCNNIKTWSY